MTCLQGVRQGCALEIYTGAFWGGRAQFSGAGMRSWGPMLSAASERTMAARSNLFNSSGSQCGKRLLVPMYLHKKLIIKQKKLQCDHAFHDENDEDDDDDDDDDDDASSARNGQHGP